MLIFFCIKRTFAHFGQKTEVSDLNGLYFSIKSSKLYVYLLIYTHEIYSIIFIIIIFLIKINIRLISIIPWNREWPTSPKPNTVREVHVAKAHYSGVGPLLIPYFVCLRFACQTLGNPKILFSLYRAMRTSRTTWRNPFGQRSTRSAFLAEMTKMPLVNPRFDRR